MGVGRNLSVLKQSATKTKDLLCLHRESSFQNVLTGSGSGELFSAKMIAVKGRPGGQIKGQD